MKTNIFEIDLFRCEKIQTFKVAGTIVYANNLTKNIIVSGFIDRNHLYVDEVWVNKGKKINYEELSEEKRISIYLAIYKALKPTNPSLLYGN